MFIQRLIFLIVTIVLSGYCNKSEKEESLELTLNPNIILKSGVKNEHLKLYGIGIGEESSKINKNLIEEVSHNLEIIWLKGGGAYSVKREKIQTLKMDGDILQKIDLKSIEEMKRVLGNDYVINESVPTIREFIYSKKKLDIHWCEKESVYLCGIIIR